MSSQTDRNQRHVKANFPPFSGAAVRACGGRRQAIPFWCLHPLCGCRGEQGSQEVPSPSWYRDHGDPHPDCVCCWALGYPGCTGSISSLLPAERRDKRDCACEVPRARSERGAWSEALEADRSTGVHSRSAGGRVTSPAWAQMAPHMALPLPKPCPLRQHLRSQQGLAETLQSFLSPCSCWDSKGWWVCKWQAALLQSGEGYLVTFRKTMPTSLCPGVGDLPAPGIKGKGKTRHSGAPLPIPRITDAGLVVPCLRGHHSVVWLVMHTHSCRETSNLGSEVAALTSQVLQTQHGVNCGACHGALGSKHSSWLACLDGPNRTSSFYVMLEHYVSPPHRLHPHKWPHTATCVHTGGTHGWDQVSEGLWQGYHSDCGSGNKSNGMSHSMPQEWDWETPGIP